MYNSPPILWLTDMYEHCHPLYNNFSLDKLIYSQSSPIILYTGTMRKTSSMITQPKGATLYYLTGFGQLKIYGKAVGLEQRNFVYIDSSTILIGVEGHERKHTLSSKLDYFEKYKSLFEKVNRIVICTIICPFAELYRDVKIKHIDSRLGQIIKRFCKKNKTFEIFVLCSIPVEYPKVYTISEQIKIGFTYSFSSTQKHVYITFGNQISLSKDYLSNRLEKLVFLDIDGVINCKINPFPSKQEYDYVDYPLFDELYIGFNPLLCQRGWNRKSIEVLKEITDGNVGIVITSNWRFKFTYEQLLFLFDLYGLGKYVVGFTCSENGFRGLEILQYLRQHPSVCNFVVLDDKDEGISFLFPDNYVRIVPYLSNVYSGVIGEKLM